jgi:hypothetical protein
MPQVTTIQMAILIGAGGGAAAEVVHWIRLIKSGLSLKTSWLYWAATLGGIVLGGLVPLLYIDLPMSAVLIFHLGASAPIIVENLVSKPPTTPDGFTAHSTGGKLGAIERLRAWARW